MRPWAMPHVDRASRRPSVRGVARARIGRPPSVWLGALLCLLSCELEAGGDPPAPVRVASKKFTENVILGEMLSILARDAGAGVEHLAELGGTRILWDALVGGEIDAYPEYTGTITREILAGESIAGDGELRHRLEEIGLGMSRPLGFNNTYALGMKRERAEELGIRRISDLVARPSLRIGCTSEFLDRSDGWPGLRRRYGLPHDEVTGLDHDLAYRGLELGAIDVMDVYSTDAEIVFHDIRLLEDDRGFFTAYEAVIVHRADLEVRAPQVIRSWRRLEGALSDARMTALNERAKVDRVPENAVAAEFLRESLGVRSQIAEEGVIQRVLSTTADHLALVAPSLLAAILTAIPLGVWAARSARSAPWILGAVGVIQTVPALALLVLLMPALELLHVSSLGRPPAIAALFLYSLLPVVRNTYTGLRDIPLSLRESAEALGLPAAARLRLVDLPLASGAILAGVKTAAVINVGFATLGALIGARGYGQPILTGIRLHDNALILQGAVPAALLALLVQGLFELAERRLVPRGLRLGSAGE